MKNLHTSRNLILLAAVLTALFFGWFTWATCTFTVGPCFDRSIQPGPRETHTVTFVIDGDSFTIERGREVRLIGIDAPERGDPYYAQARQALAELIDGKEIILESDTDNRDRYGRILRYAYVDDTFVNAYMLEHGFAWMLTISPNVRYVEQLQKANQKARAEERGVWSTEQ